MNPISFGTIQTLKDLQASITLMKNQGIDAYNLSPDTKLIISLGKLEEHKLLQVGTTGVATQTDGKTGEEERVFFIELVEKPDLRALLQEFLKKKLEEEEVGGHA